MSKQSKQFRSYGFIKGGLGEVLIERLFHDLGFEVHPYGFEKKLPRHLLNLHYSGEVKLQVFQRSENDPDFILYRPGENGRLAKGWAVEVKFRTSGCIKIDKLEVYKQDNVLFLLIDTRNIYCLPAAEMDRFRKRRSGGKGDVVFNQCTPLEAFEAFEFSQSERLAVRRSRIFIQHTLGRLSSESIVLSHMNALYRLGDCKKEFNQSTV